MRKQLAILGIGALVLGVAGAASAATLDFESVSDIQLGTTPPTITTSVGVATVNSGGASGTW